MMQTSASAIRARLRPRTPPPRAPSRWWATTRALYWALPNGDREPAMTPPPARPAGPDGLLVLDKPGGLTSRAALDRALRWFPRGTRMGHTGTLDPLATGVLVLCLGSATRLAEYVQRMGKTYRTGILLGARSDTDDADGTVVPVAGARAPSAADGP